MPAIQSGRYKIWRTPEKTQLLVSFGEANSMAVLMRPEEMPKDNPEYPETGIWIVNVLATPTSSSVPPQSSTTTTHAGVDDNTATATIQHEPSQGYLTVDNPAEADRGSPIYVKADHKQTWLMNSAAAASSTVHSEFEFHIGYPELNWPQRMVVDNSFAKAWPPRLALQPYAEDVPQFGGPRPWLFEPVE